MQQAGQFSEVFYCKWIKRGKCAAPLLFTICFGAIVVAIQGRLVEKRVHFVRMYKLSSNPFKNDTLFKNDTCLVY